MIFCTLFDSNYLDKGIVLIKSLEDVCNDFKIYVLALDGTCFSILNDIKKDNRDNIHIINIDDFVAYEDLKSEQHNRPRAEFCWTCTPHLIDYVIRKFNEETCTYIDADMFFYMDPQLLIDEMEDKSVQIVEHRFTNSIEDKISRQESGTFCVEFNTFTSREDSMELLRWWKRECKKSCSNSGEDSTIFGDQMYLETWGTKSFVSILRNLGGGVAPWNIGQYRLISTNDNKIVLQRKKTKEKFELIFYHFHNLTYLDKNHVDISIYQRAWGIDDKLVTQIYVPYLLKLQETKQWLLEYYGLNIYIHKHPAFETKKIRSDEPKTQQKRHLFTAIYLIINSGLRKVFQAKKNIISLLK